ncbi:MAG: lamin tail domain-containing protein [Adhaeribacter sp.]
MRKYLSVLFFFCSLSAWPQSRLVRLNEVFSDPNPPVGLPEAEFIELFNTSAQPQSLAGWKYSDATAAAGILPAYTLAPGAFLILCRAADTLLFQAYGPVLGLRTFPALNDGGDVVELFDAQDRLVDRLTYTPDWYQDEGKSRGGWSLELVNPALGCSNAAAYKASLHPAGGTPGRQNSVFDSQPDRQPPQLLRVQVTASRQLRLLFSEALDSLSAVEAGRYQLSPSLALARASLPDEALREVVLDLQDHLQPRQAYTLQVRQVRDCAGNEMLPASQSLALPEEAAAGEVVINEILFNPLPGGVDFVELVNRSPKYLDLKDWQLASEKPDGSLETAAISRESFILAPQQYLALSTRPDMVRQHYVHSPPEAFLPLPGLPSFADEAGTVLLRRAGGELIDRLEYHEDMHFALLEDRNGVSLERIRLTGDSSRSNWHSAASTAGFATPGYRNSQLFEVPGGPGVFVVEPNPFTPDGDGDRDFTTISYQPGANGFMASITIYDAEGREIRRLVKNQLLASRGFFQWDGLNERGQKAAIGYYVLFIELYQPGGTVKVYKQAVALGARF